MSKQGTNKTTTLASRSGAASIYVVVVAALLFSIITVSFIRILLRNASNSAANEMAQMAYDSALAGVEDAKTAISNYRACRKEGFTSVKCQKIRAAVEASYRYADGTLTGSDALEAACDSVKKAITGSDATGETLIQEYADGKSSTEQAYTCVLLAEDLKDYRSSLSEANTMRVIQLLPKPKETDDAACTTNLYSDDCLNAAAHKVKYVRIDWYSRDNNSGHRSFSFGQADYFGQATDSSVRPPVLSAQLIQTQTEFSLDDFQNSNDANSDRALVYLTPKSIVSTGSSEVFADDVLKKNDFAKTNDHDNFPENAPKNAQCVNSFDDNDFACAKVLELPGTYPSNTSRNWQTFYLVLALPYRAPETDFSIRMYTCEEGAKEGSNVDEEEGGCLIKFSGAQVAVDSTGRANDLYSRVESRIEFTDITFPFPQYALQATSNEHDAINKNFYITQDCIKSTRNADGEIEIKSCPNSAPVD